MTQPGYSPPPPPSGGGSNWWKWVLGGCGGCLLLVIIAMTVGGFAIKNMFDRVAGKVGPVDPVSIQAKFGDVPLYPGASLDVNTTRMMMQMMAVGESFGGKKVGDIFRGIAVLSTQDAAEKVFSYYQQTLTSRGWVRAQEQERGSNARAVQRAYRKGNEFVMVQVQNRQDQQPGTMIILMRGGAELMKQGPPKLSGTGGAT